MFFQSNYFVLNFVNEKWKIDTIPAYEKNWENCMDNKRFGIYLRLKMSNKNTL